MPYIDVETQPSRCEHSCNDRALGASIAVHACPPRPEDRKKGTTPAGCLWFVLAKPRSWMTNAAWGPVMSARLELLARA
eukprot:scaffold50_cov420-Prasinococcus_capsulatus_cf.AAC.3